MRLAQPMSGVLAGCVLLLSTGSVGAQDWPQWRGPNRDSKVTGFTAPKEWPKTLTQKWKVSVGQGDSSPVLVRDKIYVFGRVGGDEVLQCLDAATGNELWKDKYEALPPTGASAGPGGIHKGPRATPAVGAGKVCTFGVRGTVSCVDAATGKLAWRKDTKGYPMFFTASSPLIADGKCIVFHGGSGTGKISAYDLANGDEKWTWTGESPSYGSPTLMTVDGTKMLVTLTQSSLVGIGLADGKQLWKVPFSAKYNNSTPIVNRDTVICSSPARAPRRSRLKKRGTALRPNSCGR